jgi:hypothetical protein
LWQASTAYGGTDTVPKKLGTGSACLFAALATSVTAWSSAGSRMSRLDATTVVLLTCLLLLSGSAAAALLPAAVLLPLRLRQRREHGARAVPEHRTSPSSTGLPTPVGRTR